MKRIIAFVVTGLLMTTSFAQGNYPARSVSAVVGFVPGGAADLVMRQLAILMQPRFPHGIVVENKPGAGGSTVVGGLARGKPDGYQFAFVPNSNLALSPQISALSYKNPDDVDPVINVVRFSPLLLVNNASPYKNIKELAEAAKKAPGTLSMGYPGNTTLSHLNVLELERSIGAEFTKVPFTGWGQGGPQLLGGHISASVAQPIEAVPYIKAGTMRALGSFSELRQSLLPNVPTMKEQGFEGAIGARYLIIVPKGTPVDIVKHIHDAAKAAMESPQFKDFLTANALELAYQDGATARDAAWTDFRNYKAVIERNGLHLK